MYESSHMTGHCIVCGIPRAIHKVRSVRKFDLALCPPPHVLTYSIPGNLVNSLDAANVGCSHPNTRSSLEAGWRFLVPGFSMYYFNTAIYGSTI